MSRWERLGLRARITLLFALGGLLLANTIGLVTLTLTRRSLLVERDAAALASFAENGQRFQRQVGDDPAAEGVAAILESLTTTSGALPLVRFGDEWNGLNLLVFSEETVPATLLGLVSQGSAGRTRITLNGEPAIVSGVQLPGRDAAYFEAVLIGEVDDTLRSLGLILLGVGTVTTLVAAAFGLWASRRALRPLADIRTAAESLAAGELQTRLDPPADADLASLSASFNGMAQSLEDRIERDARFASEVSHELRSPLMTFSASAEVLNNDRDKMSERSQTALVLLTDDIARFTQLVENLLEISRYDVGTAALQAEPVFFAEFVRHAISYSTRPDIALSVSEEGESLVIVADKRRLAQVIANLVDNADKYGGGNFEVEISSEQDVTFLVVQDHGPGVPVAERQIIFDRFSRGSSGRRRGQNTGTGLGLSLVSEHVRLHNGRVWVEDRLNGRPGARMVVALPIRIESDHDQ